jgi:hypothetical protein
MAELSLAFADSDADRAAGLGEGRFSLRRCGRLRGSEPITSEGRSSLNYRHDGVTGTSPSAYAESCCRRGRREAPRVRRCQRNRRRN